jgi:hypothetical protein
MNIKMRFWCPSQKKFLNEVRSWTTHDGDYSAIGTREEEVIPQLSTGCHDKNKTEIFDGDKIRYYGNVGTVEFFAGSFRVDWGDQTDDDVGTMQISLMEVVGHMYDAVPIPAPAVEPEEDEELDLERCEQCDEPAWDGYICHACGAKNI